MRFSDTIGYSSSVAQPARGAGLLSRIQSSLEAYRANRALNRGYRRDAAQLARFNDRELWDLGLSRSDIPGIANGTFRRD